MEHDGHRQRMRERFCKQGLDGFAPHEALELLLFYAIPQRNVNPLAHALIDRFGSLRGVLEAKPEQLRQVEGIGDCAATYLSLLGKTLHYVGRQTDEDRPKISNRRRAEEYCLHLLEGEKNEMFYAVCLNGQMQVLGDALIANGSLSDVQAYPRLVVQAVLDYNAHAVVLCHNHPGGSLEPSQADLDTTEMLLTLLSGVEVILADHIIVSAGQTFSMVSHHLIERTITPTGVEMHVADSSGNARVARRSKNQTEEP